MSVSFYPEISDTVPVRITCSCGEANYNGLYTTRQAAVKAMRTMVSTCTEPYCEYLKVVEAVPEPEVNFSNANAAELFSYLGFTEEETEEYVGSMDAEEFLGRVILAKGLIPYGTGLTTMQVENIVYCGRPANYFQVRLDQLEEVARFAIKNKRLVVWG